MYSSRLVQLLLLALAVCYVAEASWWNLGSHGMRARQLGDLIGGGDGDDGDSPSDAATDSSSSSSSSSSTSESTTSTVKTTTSTDPKPTEEPNNDPTDPADPTAPPTTSSSTRPQQTSTTTSLGNDNPDTTSAPSNPQETSAGSDESSKESSEHVVSTDVQVVTLTKSDGSLQTTTSVSRHTSTPGLNDESNETSGMSEQTRNTVIGVVVGVGGAIIIGALALVAWRIRGRRKRVEESDGLMDYNNNVNEKPDGPPGSAPSVSNASRSPFQSTLENYHQPTHVNASSNF